MADEELEIELPEVKKTEPEIEIEKKAETVDDGIEALRQQLETEKAGKAEANARAAREANAAREAEDRANRATTEARDSNLNLVTGAIDQIKSTMDLLEERYADAAAAGDHRAMAKITREFSDSSAKLSQLETGKVEMERVAKEPAPQNRREIADPVEALAGQMQANGSPRSAQWIRDHPDYARDPNLNRKMLAAHNLAIADGHAADTDGYFDAIEDVLKLREVQVDPTPKPRQAAPPPAPSSRAAATNNGTQTNRVRLTSDEVEMAEMMGMTPQEYAKNKLALKGEGRLN